MKNIFVAIIVFASASLFAQNFNQYAPLQCVGKIPEEFLIPSSKKYKSEIQRAEKKKIKKQELKDRKRFALESNFVIDDMLQSGLVLFGDPVSLYLNDVAAQIIAANPTFKRKVNVYALRSKAVNAFATDRGTIFVTLGLLAQLENEAQLAYILAHELVHIQEGHAMDLYLEAKDISRNASRRSVYEKASFDEQLLSKNRYSRKLETEADNKGLDYYLLTKYSTDEISSVFDVLQYAYLPFDEVRFEQSFFESGSYKLPGHYWLAEVKPINGEVSKEEQEKSTHPDVDTRRKDIKARLDKHGKSGDKLFLVSEERFRTVRQSARFELPYLYLHNSQIAESIYSAYLLLKQYPDNAYLQKCIAKALYIQAKYKNDGDYKINSKWANREGELQRLQFLTDTIVSKDATILALRYAWQQYKLHPEDSELTTITNDLFTELGYHSNSLSDFDVSAGTGSTTVPEPEKPKEEEKKKTKEKNKYEKIKEQKAKTAPATDGWRAAFEEFKSDNAFIKAFDEGQKRYKKIEEKTAYFESDKGKAERRKTNARIKKHGNRLGIDKLIVINPYYLKLDARKSNAVQYIQSESGQINLKEIVEATAKKAGIKATLLDVASLKDGQVDRFNDIRLLNDWFEEQTDYNDLSVTPGVSQKQVSAVADKYGAEHVLYTGVISLREAKKGAALAIAAGILYLPVLPFSIYWAAKPEYDMLHYAILFNVKEGTFQTLKYEYFDARDTDTMLKAHYYDTFAQIKAKPKKKSGK